MSPGPDDSCLPATAVCPLPLGSDCGLGLSDHQERSYCGLSTWGYCPFVKEEQKKKGQKYISPAVCLLSEPRVV